MSEAAAAVTQQQTDEDPDWVALRALVDEIRTAEAHRLSLYDARRDLFARLLAKGHRRSVIARVAQVSDMAVEFAVNPAAKVKKQTGKPLRKSTPGRPRR